MGGVVVDGGNFDWNHERFPNFVQPDPSYHGVSYADDFGPLAFISKARAGILRDIGACQSPFNSWLLIQGLETLSLRMERHVSNAGSAPRPCTSIWRRVTRFQEFVLRLFSKKYLQPFLNCFQGANLL